MTRHAHRAKSSRDRCWMGCADSTRCHDERSHGNIQRLDTCRCGAERRTDINGWNVFRGP